MGLDLAYQAIPPGSDLVEIARRDVENGWALAFVPAWFSAEDGGPRPGREGGGQVSRGRIWDECCRLVGIWPDLRTRNCLLDREWDVLHYLLSATHRGEPAAASDIAIDRAFDAGDLIADHVRGSQGVPVRYLSPAAVRDVAAVVGPLNEADLSRHYDPPRLESAAVYKFWADRADAAQWDQIVHYFDAFRTFFVRAADRGDAVITCVD